MRMTIRVLAATALLALPAMLPAQSSIGIKGGLTFATLSNKSPDWDTRSGFAAGLAFDLRSGPVGIQPEILYVQKGVSFDGSPTEGGPKLDYLEIPVLLKFTVPTEGIQPFIYGGPSFGLRLSCKVAEITCDDDEVKSTDFGAALGAGIRVGGDKGLTIEGRYTWGMRDLGDFNSGVDSKTRTFMVLLGFSL